MNHRKTTLVLVVLTFSLIAPVHAVDKSERSIRGFWLTDLDLPDTIHAGEQVEVEFTYDYNFSYVVDLYFGTEYLSDVPINLWLWNMGSDDIYADNSFVDEYFNVTGEGTDTFVTSFTAPEEGTYELMARADYLTFGASTSGEEYFFVASMPMENVTLTMTVLPAQPSGSTPTNPPPTDTDESTGGGIPGFPLAAVLTAIPLALYKRKRR